MDLITILNDANTWTPITGTRVRVVTALDFPSFDNGENAKDFPNAKQARSWALDSPKDLRSLARFLEKHTT